MKHLALRHHLLPLAEFKSVRWVKLFGSRAKGENKEHSDFDLAVCGEGDYVRQWQGIEDAVKNAALLPVDVVDYAVAPDALKQAIDRSGQIVFVNKRSYVALIRLAKAMESLEDIVHDEDDPKHKQRDALISRFCSVMELFWKVFKELEAEEGFEENSPRSAIARAFQLGWIADEAAWREMLKDRNNAAHIYNEAMAKEIFRNILDNFAELKTISEKLNVMFVENVKV